MLESTFSFQPGVTSLFSGESVPRFGSLGLNVLQISSLSIFLVQILLVLTPVNSREFVVLPAARSRNGSMQDKGSMLLRIMHYSTLYRKNFEVGRMSFLCTCCPNMSAVVSSPHHLFPGLNEHDPVEVVCAKTVYMKSSLEN